MPSDPNAPTLPDSAVATILAARSNGTTFETLDPHAPASTAEAYAIDDQVHELLNKPVLGWKIGCTSELAQQLLGSDGPMSGRVYEAHASGASLSMAQYPGAYLEGEFAFTMAADLAPTAEPRTPEAVAAAVASVHPCIELVGGRCSNFLASPINSVIADAGANGALVVGAAIEDWRSIDLVQTPGSMSVGGAETGSGTGADVLGSPLLSLTWLVNHLSERGITLHADAVVSTGTCTGVTPAVAGATVVADFGPLGRVQVDFS